MSRAKRTEPDKRTDVAVTFRAFQCGHCALSLCDPVPKPPMKRLELKSLYQLINVNSASVSCAKLGELTVSFLMLRSDPSRF
jgi:hypothetical protein